MLPEQKAKARKDSHTTTTTTARDNSNNTTSIHNNRPATYKCNKGKGTGKQYDNFDNHKGASKKGRVYNIQETTDHAYYGYYDDNDRQPYWPEVDYSQFQQPAEEQPSQPQQHSLAATTSSNGDAVQGWCSLQHQLHNSEGFGQQSLTLELQ
eukprot:307748-Amphidinium_carterae.3